MEKMSIADYVAYRKRKKNKITGQAVCKAIRMGHRTPGIKKAEMYGGTYVLDVDLVELNTYLVYIKKPINLQTKVK